tara:strand:- start:418 stop:1131 length:714 start_codon:yes stop_codon:yes gene_type:complete
VNYGEPESGFDNLKELYREYGLVHIKCDKPLSLEEFKNLGEGLGKPLKIDKHSADDGFVQRVATDGLFEDKNVDWHNDWSYGKGEYYATILYNVKNGDLSPTWFCDMANAPEELKEKYKTFTGEYHPPGYLHNGCFSERQLRALRRLKVTRPFVFEYNGRSVLYCSLATITEVKNSLETSDLNSLDFEDIREYVNEDNYKHDWEPNDILIWDNLRMQHKREEFKGDRELWRIQLDLQ